MTVKKNAVYQFILDRQELESRGIFIPLNVDGSPAFQPVADNLKGMLCATLEERYGVCWEVDKTIILGCAVSNKRSREMLYKLLLITTDLDTLEEWETSTTKVEDVALPNTGYERYAPFVTRKTAPNLFRWGENICSSKIPQRVGFDKYIKRMEQILARKTKNNVILVGDKGVGKTSAVEEFARRMYYGAVPKKLRNSAIIRLDTTKLISGCRYRGDFEERMQIVCESAREGENVILFVDDIHTLLGLGASQGQEIDGMAILLPYLEKGDFSIVGCTSHAKWQHRFDTNDGVSRMFQTIDVLEPDIEQAEIMISNEVTEFEGYHNLVIPATATKLAVELAKRYRTNRCLPDSAIDLLDEACSKASLEQNEEHSNLDTKYLYEIISEELGVPITKLSSTEAQRMQSLETALRKRVIGQDEAVAALAKAIRCSRVGLQDSSKPLGSFIFAGSTGVGKTELCKALAAELFADEKAITRFDMSEYMEGHSVSKLIGAPAGYVGYGEGGLLTDAVSKKPYSILLFDELEKAHPDVLNLLLQILDDGRLTDSMGKTVDFKNTVIIMTTNAGAKRKGEDTKMGFITATDKDRKGEFMKAIKGLFKPEFLNRIDDIIVFNSITDDVLEQITRKLLDEMVSDCKAQNLNIYYDDSVVQWCIDEGADSEYGARPLKHFIDREIRTAISDCVINGVIKARTKYKLSYAGALHVEKVVKTRSKDLATI